MASQRLPEDAVVEILSRVPAKALLRFRSVCKTWSSLIQSPNFISLHHQQNTENDSILVVRCIPTIDPHHQQQRPYNDSRYRDTKIVLSFLSHEENPNLITDEVTLPRDLVKPMTSFSGNVRVFGPCNGVICLTDLSNIVLCNPSIREFNLVPFPPFSYTRGFDPFTEAVGFGFDPLASDYKVLRILQLIGDDGECPILHSTNVEVYNLSTDSWRQVDVSVPLELMDAPCFEMFFNGAFHFYVWQAILSFDISKEVFRVIPFPEDGRYQSLSILNDSLALILFDDPSEVEEKHYHIWVMNEYGVKESWTRLYSVGPLIGVDWPLAFQKDAELFFESSNGQLVSCDLSTQEIKELQVYGIPMSLRVLSYTESLMSIKRDDHLG